MTESRRPKAGLGRGLNALLGEISTPQTQAETPDQGGSIRLLPVTAIAPHPDQPRRRFDDAALDELAASIAKQGIIQPLVVRPAGRGYQIVAGERRWRAAQRARLHEVPVVVRDYSEDETLQIALVENIQRQDLNAIEEAQAYRRLLSDYGHTQEAVAQVVHKSRSHIANLLRLLDLDPDIQALVVEGTLSMGHARALVGADDALDLAEQITARGLNVRQTERLVRDRRRPRDEQSSRSHPSRDADIDALERQLADLLGLKIRIAHGPDGGSITIDYATLDQLDMLCQRLTGETI